MLRAPRQEPVASKENPEALGTHDIRILGPKTILYKAFWAILSLRETHRVGFGMYFTEGVELCRCGSGQSKHVWEGFV